MNFAKHTARLEALAAHTGLLRLLSLEKLVSPPCLMSDDSNESIGKCLVFASKRL